MVNPLLDTLDHHGLPDFTSLRTEHYREGFDKGFAEHLVEVEVITANAEEPSFENSVLALERSGRTLERVATIFFNKVSSDSDDELRDLEAEVAPRLAAHEDRIQLDPVLFERVSAVRSRADSLQLDDESRFLVERTHIRMQLAGAGLGEQDKQRLRELNQELSELTTAYQRHLLAEQNDTAVLFGDVAELDGLTPGQLSACRQAAQARGLDGWLVTMMLFTDHPYQAQLTDRESRRRIHEASESRGRRGNEHDTRALVSRITALRAERAGLLGHPNHAAASLADQTARTPEQVEQVVYPLAAPVRRNIEREASRLQALVDQDLGEDSYRLEPWDWSFWTERLREREYQLDTTALRPWFEYERVLFDGVFWAATQLYGVTFTERPDLVCYHPDARVFEVRNEDGSELGLFVHDVFTRDSKRGGAWMNNLVQQSHLFDERPVVVNNLNVPRPGEGEPVLLSLDEVDTMFHEFGHALHGLFSDATYPSLSGTAVSRDFVEFPSQVNEMWITWPEVVEHYARRHRTGEPLPEQVLASLAASETFNQGFSTGEYLASALLDQEWHKIAPGVVVDDVEAFEAEALQRIGLDNPWVGPRYRSTYFSHTFAGGYDAGYYSYIYSEILDADTVEWFKENGGLRRENGQRFRDELLSRGRTREPMDSYRAFRGRDPEITPLLRRRGLAD